MRFDLILIIIIAAGIWYWWHEHGPALKKEAHEAGELSKLLDDIEGVGFLHGY